MRTSPERVLQLVRDPASYPEWWPGSRRRGGETSFPGAGPLRLDVVRVREPDNVELKVQGRRFRGRLEWYLEPIPDGTIVWAIFDFDSERRWSNRRVLRFRSALRTAMVAMKHLLE